MDLHITTSENADPRVDAGNYIGVSGLVIDKDNRKHRRTDGAASGDIQATSTSAASYRKVEDTTREADERAIVSPNCRLSGKPIAYPSDLVDFDSADDPENPKNFSTARKWAITASMGSMTFVTTFASSIFSVAVGPVSQEYNISHVAATLGTSLFLLVCTPSNQLR